MKVFITVDVECYTGDFEREVWANGLGLDYIVDQCARHGAPATYFVEALCATRWGSEPLERICRRIMEGGQRVELHLHPSVAVLDGFQDQHDVFLNQDRATQLRLLTEGIRCLKQAGVPSVSAFRAGDLAANADTLTAMKEAGLPISSNRDLCLVSSIRTQLNEAFPVANDLSRQDGVLDVPVTCLRSPLPFLDGPFRHLEISAVSSREMCWSLDRLSKEGYAAACILTHPPEFYRWNNGRPWAIAKNCRRFEDLLRFLKSRTDMEACVISEQLISNKLSEKSRKMPTLPAWFSLLRVVEQGWYRMRYGARDYL